MNRGRGRRARAAASIGGAGGHDPVAGLAGDGGDAVEIGVVVEYAQVARRYRGEWQVGLTFANPSTVCAFQLRVQLLDRDGARVTPLFASDRYLTVLPGTSREIVLATRATPDRPQLVLSGWNVPRTSVPVRWRRGRQPAHRSSLGHGSLAASPR